MAFLRHLWASLVGIRDYQSLAAAGLGRACGHICLLILILTIAYGIRAFDKTRNVLAYWAEEIVGWPDFRLEGGRLEFSGEMPFITVQDDTAFVIDTEGEEGRALFAQYAEGILLTASQVYYKNQGTPTTPLNWSNLPFETSRDRLARGLPGWVWPITALIVLGLLLYNLAAKGISALILGLAGLAVAGGRVSFNRAFPVSLYAMTGPILLSLAKNLTYPKLPFFFVLYWGWALTYVLIAVLTAKKGMESGPGDPGAPIEEERVSLI